ncbi:TRAP transporter substrate-binding protein [Marinobacterium rhizophilum]|uniref:TRAP transporter substrate-binding protein n=1 Tax=Marinobacterium rhizophilum TaxID=420402 RepID=A0ABY5HNQ7_9GAMM|nr:TRAP transporter substrate-binding protein [Marinobacterium rhizophilum]UTW13417.1 TRAP transporter substrate-binding protein [Marinobacterium rhizophilum]
MKLKSLALSVLSLTLAGPVAAETMLRIQTAQNSGDFVMSRLQDVWLPKLEQMSGGSLTIELLPTGAVVPHRETPKAVGAGILDGQMTAPNYFAGHDPAFALFGDLIAAYDSPDQGQTFCRNGGGREVLQQLYDHHFGEKMKVIGCGPYAREALVVATPIETLADLAGKKIRAPEGLAAEVFREVGATPVSLPFSEVYTALETGLVDAADASALVNNEALGLHKIAKYPIYPGIHSQAVHSFSVNKAKWNALTAQEQAILEIWYNAAYDDIRRAADLEDKKTAQELAEREGFKVIDWSAADRQAFRIAAKKAWERAAGQSEDAKIVYTAQIDYLRQIGLYSDK